MALLKNTKKVWRKDSEFKGKADAELVQEEINSVASQDANGKCTNEALVDYARNNPASESHKCFEWNDTEAAEKFRLHQAARIKCAIMTIVVESGHQDESEENGTKTAAPAQITFETMTNHSIPTAGEGHKDIEIILQDKNDTSALDKEMGRSIHSLIESFQRRYCLAPSYPKVEPMLNKLLASLAKAGI